MKNSSSRYMLKYVSTEYYKHYKNEIETHIAELATPSKKSEINKRRFALLTQKNEKILDEKLDNWAKARFDTSKSKISGKEKKQLLTNYVEEALERIYYLLRESMAYLSRNALVAIESIIGLIWNELNNQAIKDDIFVKDVKRASLSKEVNSIYADFQGKINKVISRGIFLLESTENPGLMGILGLDDHTFLFTFIQTLDLKEYTEIFKDIEVAVGTFIDPADDQNEDILNFVNNKNKNNNNKNNNNHNNKSTGGHNVRFGGSGVRNNRSSDDKKENDDDGDEDYDILMNQASEKLQQFQDKEKKREEAIKQLSDTLKELKEKNKKLALPQDVWQQIHAGQQVMNQQQQQQLLQHHKQQQLQQQAKQPQNQMLMDFADPITGSRILNGGGNQNNNNNNNFLSNLGNNNGINNTNTNNGNNGGHTRNLLSSYGASNAFAMKEDIKNMRVPNGTSILNDAIVNYNGDIQRMAQSNQQVSAETIISQIHTAREVKEMEDKLGNLQMVKESDRLLGEKQIENLLCNGWAYLKYLIIHCFVKGWIKPCKYGTNIIDSLKGFWKKKENIPILVQVLFVRLSKEATALLLSGNNGDMRKGQRIMAILNSFNDFCVDYIFPSCNQSDLGAKKCWRLLTVALSINEDRIKDGMNPVLFSSSDFRLAYMECERGIKVPVSVDSSMGATEELSADNKYNKDTTQNTTRSGGDNGRNRSQGGGYYNNYNGRGRGGYGRGRGNGGYGRGRGNFYVRRGYPGGGRSRGRGRGGGGYYNNNQNGYQYNNNNNNSYDRGSGKRPRDDDGGYNNNGGNKNKRNVVQRPQQRGGETKRSRKELRDDKMDKYEERDGFLWAKHPRECECDVCIYFDKGSCTYGHERCIKHHMCRYCGIINVHNTANCNASAKDRF